VNNVRANVIVSYYLDGILDYSRVIRFADRLRREKIGWSNVEVWYLNRILRSDSYNVIEK